MKIEFKRSDAWLLTSIIFAQRDKNGPFLWNVFAFSDLLNKIRFLVDEELYPGFERLLAADIVEYGDGKFICKEWFLERFQDVEIANEGFTNIEKVDGLLNELSINVEVINEIDSRILNDDIIMRAEKQYRKWFREEMKRLKSKE